MELKEAIQLMKLDLQVLYDGKPEYILYIDSLHQTCTLSDHPADYVGKIVVSKNVNIKILQRK